MPCLFTASRWGRSLSCLLLALWIVSAASGQTHSEKYTPQMAVDEIDYRLADFKDRCRSNDGRACWAFRKLLAQGHNRVRNEDHEMALENYRWAICRQTDSEHAFSLMTDIDSILLLINAPDDPELLAAAAPSLESSGHSYHVFESDRRKVEEIWLNSTQRSAVFRKITHRWGGVYYFKQTTCISEGSWQAIYNQLTERDLAQGLESTPKT